ncbi:MAG: hypothetical protein MJ153_02325 [Clostridia bacterium]|nr:hypothetical protein [Clostridia bacterium]
MIKIIAGQKGTGKTAKLVDDINQVAVEDNNVVCIERGNRLDQLLKCKVRLINIDEYPCTGYDQLLAFICGICSKDYDISHIFIDSIKKVSKSTDMNELSAFLTELDKLAAASSIAITIILSEAIDTLPDSIKAFC